MRLELLTFFSYQENELFINQISLLNIGLFKIQKKAWGSYCYLPHVPGLRTCHPVKISNFEAHADICIRKSLWLLYGKTSQYNSTNTTLVYTNIPRTSTIASSTTGNPSVRSLERRDERLVNAFNMSWLFPLTHPSPCQ